MYRLSLQPLAYFICLATIPTESKVNEKKCCLMNIFHISQYKTKCNSLIITMTKFFNLTSYSSLNFYISSMCRVKGQCVPCPQVQ